MSGSFDRIDYTVRPAKYAERRMLRDIFRKVHPFAPPEDYVYVGFGSVWFADFILFHRTLGVRRMISIEGAAKAEQRVKDNAPFNIEIKFGRSEKVLPTMDWTPYQFLWLDYDDQIDPNKLGDSDIVARNCKSGTLLAATFRASEPKQRPTSAAPGSATIAFQQAFDAALLPTNLADDDLAGYAFARLSRTILLTQIEASLDVRNAGTADPMQFLPICSIDYADGTLMTTLVGMFIRESETQLADECRFQELDFIDHLGDNIRIEVPLMTPREVRLIEAQLPSRGAQIEMGSIPEKQVSRFVKFYRHFPSYMVAES